MDAFEKLADGFNKAAKLLKDVQNGDNLNKIGESLSLGKHSNVVIPGQVYEQILGFNPTQTLPSGMSKEKANELIKDVQNLEKVLGKAFDHMIEGTK